MFPQTLPIHAQSFLAGSEPHHSLPSHPLDSAQVLLREEESLRLCSLPPIFAALEALDACPTLRDLITSFPPHIQYAIKASMLISDRSRHVRLQVLEMLLDTGQSMSNVWEQVGPVSPASIFHHASVFGVIEGLCLEPSKYRRELAFLFTQLSIYRLPAQLQQKMAISPATLPLTVLPAYAFWYLCSAAEYRLTQAMEDQAVLLVNDVILLKFYGKLGGIALQTTLLSNGTQLIEGCWYAPIEHRDEIRDAFDRGESRLCVQGEWTLLRALDEASDDKLLQHAQTFAATLPAQLPLQIAGYPSRRTYRCRKHEEL
ncbi:MAG: hypothetical protein H0V70_04440 [Ktedonobacteraceae bacterium]|nr:hypothetical protein [Ktedonobacteraceae bacterium]